MPKEPSSVTRGITKTFGFWQDREIRFDCNPSLLHLRENAERVYATIQHVEDTKGNIGQEGTLLVTNLRIIWWSARRRSVNLSIGLYCIQSLNLQEANSRLQGGMTEAVFISTKYGSSRFQFVFTVGPDKVGDRGPITRPYSSTPNAAAYGGGGGSTSGKDRLFSIIQSVWRAYDSSRVYREIRVRSATVAEGNVITLEGESILSKISGVINVSKDQGNIGTFVVSNLRVVWFSSTSDNFNVSIPYLQFIALRSQESKFGQTLVIETSTYAGSFVLGFRVDPPERLAMLYQEVSSLWKTWTAKPILGMKVEFIDTAEGDGGMGGVGATSPDAQTAAAAAMLAAQDRDGSMSYGGVAVSAASQYGGRALDGQHVFEEAPGDAFAAYYADEGQKGVDRRPVYDTSIGLAVEKLRRGVTLQDLWFVM